MNTYIIFAAIFSGLGILFMFLGTSKGRKKALAETEKNLLKEFNELDSVGRAEFINNAKLNKEEIIIQINNQTVNSATEIIGEVRGKFGIIEEDLNTKGKQINSLNLKTKPRQVAEDQKTLELKKFLKLIPELENVDPMLRKTAEYVIENRFDSKTNLSLLFDLLEISANYGIKLSPNQYQLRDFILKALTRDFPDEILNNPRNKILTNREVLWTKFTTEWLAFEELGMTKDKSKEVSPWIKFAELHNNGIMSDKVANDLNIVRMFAGDLTHMRTEPPTESELDKSLSELRRLTGIIKKLVNE